MSAGAAAGGAAAAAAIAQATKASGVIVRVERRDFESILARAGEALVVETEGGWFSRKYEYLTSYRGFAFYTKTDQPIDIPPSAERVRAKSIWVPG